MVFFTECLFKEEFSHDFQRFFFFVYSNSFFTEMANIVCSICIENLMAEKSEVDNVITDCGHVYHGACLAQWLEK